MSNNVYYLDRDTKGGGIMRTIMIMFDTLTRNYLPNYGCDLTVMPNFERLEDRTVTFDEFYGGSMPCMPARRELHTGKYNFLNRFWGPLEPFDESSIEILRRNGVYTHLITDHTHYFEDGGCTYHNRYDTYESFRGQEGDRWVPQGEADLSLNTCPQNKTNISAIQHLANRTRLLEESDMPSVKCVDAGCDFIDHYADRDNWFLTIECFDPHEPFYVPEKYRKLYDCVDSKNAFNFPAYGPVGDKYTEEDIMNMRKEYCALLSMCDAQVGKVLDKMDEYNMWEDTMLIVNTDHGFFLGEHGYIGKNFPPMFDEVIHTPFFIHDPRCPEATGRRKALGQTVDIPHTIMSYFNCGFETSTDGHDLLPIIRNDEKIHDTILFGVHGGQVNIYDGHYCYMRTPDYDLPLYNETVMPTNMRGFFNTVDLDKAEYVDGGRYANGHKVLRVPAKTAMGLKFPDMLYDKQADPQQKHPLHDESLETMMREKLEEALTRVEAPQWQFERLHLNKKQ